MLIKSTSRKSVKAIKQLIAYTLHIKDQTQAPEVIYTQNLRSAEASQWIREFEANEAFRLSKRRNSISCFHEILSFSPDDRPQLSTVTIRDLVQEYLSRRAPQSIALAVKHSDTDHDHVHLIISGIEYKTGRSTSISKRAFSEVKKEIEELQRSRYPELIHSFAQEPNRHPTIGRSSRSSRSNRILEFLRGTLIELGKSFHGTALLEELLGKGIEPYFRRDKLTGIRYKTQKYRFKTLGLDKDEWDRSVKEKHRDLDRNQDQIHL